MKHFALTLSPMAPDYSGACSALLNLNGLVVIHDASGCTGNYTSFDEPRWYGSQKALYCSGLRQMDAVFGNEAKLAAKVGKALRERHVDFAAVVGSPVPMVIGTDFAGVACDIEQASGIDTFGFPTNGTKFYNHGVAMAVNALIDRYAENVPADTGRALNILGATPLDFDRKNLDALLDSLREHGWTVNCCCAFDWTMEQIRTIGAARVNLAVSQAGCRIARHLQEKFGTPWVEGLPIGEKGSGYFYRLLDSAAEGQPCEPFQPADSAPTVVFGDWVCAVSICRALKLDFGIDASPAGIFGPVGAPENACLLTDEDEIEQAVRQAEQVIADPLILELGADGHPAKSVSLPQYAVSSRLYKGVLFMDNYFNKLASGLERL